MDQSENYFLSNNKLLEEKLDYCIQCIESRLDTLYASKVSHSTQSSNLSSSSSSFSRLSYLTFKAPYIRDFRNFSGPSNSDIKQIRDLTGTENIDLLIKNKSWSIQAKQQLKTAVLDHYSQLHIIELIKQKNILNKLLNETSANASHDIEQKLSLIDEQTEQVRSRKEERIFVPEDRCDQTIDWCAISAKLTNTNHDAQDCRLLWSNEIHWSINNGLWTKDEDVCLLNAVQKYGKNDWDSVAKELNSNRLPWQCCSRYQQEFVNSCFGATPINRDDSDKIIEVIDLCRIGNFVPWNQVMYFIKYHNLLQVKYQWQKLQIEKRSNQPWSHHEDVLLLAAIEKFGDKNWNRLANYVPGRSNKSCRERYIMRLKFQKRTVGNWTAKEDQTLTCLIERFGINWSLISTHLPERNCHQLRARYECLKNESGKAGPIKRKRIYRNADGSLITRNGRPQKPSSLQEVDGKLQEIFTTYANVKSSSKSSLVCRSEQDELIYQNLVQVIRNALFGEKSKHNLLGFIIDKAIKQRVSLSYELFTPCVATLRGYKAWATQQDYLKQFGNHSLDLEAIMTTSEYDELLKIVMSIFLWPSILARINTPKIETGNYQVNSIIEKNSKNLYKIREIQKRIASLDC